MIELHHSWAIATDTPKCYVRVMFLDFSRAFDHIEHDILLKKWSTTDIPQFLLRWKHSFLCQRQQRVRINSHVSEWKSPAGGTPQGTKSGPKDFKHIVRDMRAKLPLYKYVDDTTLSEVCTRGKPSTLLQDSADDISKWCHDNKMLINAQKTKETIIDFARKDSKIDLININDSEIERVDTAKLLGITISNNLSWETHVTNITNKASQTFHA